MPGSDSPRVTIGLPIFNEVSTIRSTLESALAQTFTDLEVLVVDNASDDGTGAICEELAAVHDRLRYVRNPENIGQDPNFHRVFELARGEYFRWMGAGDRLEPEYVARCVAALDGNPEAVVATVYQQHIAADGTVHYLEYKGPRPDGDDPLSRLSAMLRLLRGTSLAIDPVYSMIRRAALAETSVMLHFVFADHLVACELALDGKYLHIPECLASRELSPLMTATSRDRRERLLPAPEGGSAPRRAMTWVGARSQRVRLCAELIRSIWQRRHLGLAGRLRGTGLVIGYYVMLRAGQVRRRLRRLFHRPEPHPF